MVQPAASMILFAVLGWLTLTAGVLLEPQSPWAWAAVFELPAGDYVWSLSRNRSGDYARGSTQLLVLAAPEASASGLREIGGQAAELWPQAHVLTPGGDLRLGEGHSLATDERSWISHFPLAVPAPQAVAFFAQHAPRDFVRDGAHFFRTARGDDVYPAAEIGLLASSSFALHPANETHEHPEGEDTDETHEHAEGEHGHEGCDCDHDHAEDGHHHDEGDGDHDHEEGHNESGHHHEEGEGETSGGSLNIAKLCGMLAIIGSAVLGVGLRLRCPALNSPKMFGYVNVLAAGMFIAMALFHILPETIDHAPLQMKTLLTEEESPVSVMTFVYLGFLLVLFFERVLYDAHGAPEDPDGERDQAMREVMNPRMSFIAKVNASGSTAAETHRRPSRTSGTVGPDVQVELAERIARGSRSSASDHHDGIVMVVDAGHNHEGGHGNAEGHGHGGGGGGGKGGGTAAILLMVSLSVHSMFEGIVIGTATSAGTVGLLAVIVCCHKWAAAFAITNQLVPQDQPRGQAGFSALTKALLAIFVFSSPVGLSIGWALESAASGDGSPGVALTVSILNSLAVGTLVYISLVEVVPEEFTGSQNAMSKFAVFVAAGGLVFVLSLLHMAYGHEHGEEEAGPCGGGHNHGGHNHR